MTAHVSNNEIEAERSQPKAGGAHVCSGCGGRNFIADNESGEVACGDCGLVWSDIILDSGPDARVFDLSDRSRMRAEPAANPIMAGGRLSTKIDGRGKDYAGRQLRPDAVRSAKRINTINKRSQIEGTIERNLSHAGPYMSKLYEKLSLPKSIWAEAMAIYKKALEKDLVRGRSIESVASASLYIALRTNDRADIKRRIVDIAKAGNVEKKDITRCYRLLLDELGIEGKVELPSSRIPQIVSVMSFDQRIERTALDICYYLENGNAMRAKNVSGKDPVGLAAAAIYMARLAMVEIGLDCGHATQKEIAENAKVTEVTLRNRYGQITNAFGTNKDEWKRIAELSGKMAAEGHAMDVQAVSKLMSNLDETAALKYIDILKRIGIVTGRDVGNVHDGAAGQILYSLRKELYEA